MSLGLAPSIEIITSIFGEQWKGMVDCPKYADVTFVADSGHRFTAHKIILCCASQIFCNLFLGDVSEAVSIREFCKDVSMDTCKSDIEFEIK